MSKTFWISLFVAAWGLSASSQTVPTINACVNNLSGVTRVVASSANCVGGIETFKQWNVTGPQGAQGPAGPQGPTGARGLTGQQGAAGPTGRPGAVGTQGPQGPTGAQGPAGPSGSTGAQGPAGPAGQTGPSGATGAAGGQVYEANLTVPSSIANATPTNPAYFLGAVTGKDTLTSFSVSETPDLPSHELIVPTDCVAQNFSVTQIGAQGIDDGVVALATSTDPTGSTGITPSELVCPLAATGTTGASAVSSCSTGATAKLPAGTAIFLLVGLVSAWANAHLLVRFTCN